MDTTIINLPEIEKLNQLRERVGMELCVSDQGPSGWSKSATDPNRFLEIFSMFELKDGYILRAYQYRSGGNGNGVVWAMPEHEPFPEPDECVKSMKGSLNAPRPYVTLPNVMAGIKGDGSPWSFFCASIFSREIEEFGAIWHGCYWSTFSIIGHIPKKSNNTPRQMPLMDYSDDTYWMWVIDPPISMLPRITRRKNLTVVSFYTYSALVNETIYLNIDTYRNGKYDCVQNQISLASGKGGFIF